MTLIEKAKYLCLLFLIIMAAACEKDGQEIENLVSPLVPDETSAISLNTADDSSTLPDSGELSVTEQFMDLVNAYRESLGLESLINDEELSKIAYDHSKNMATGMIPFGHLDFTVRCSQAREILDGGNLCGENVAKGQTTPEAVYHSWMNSSGHRANIESSRYSHSGFSFARNSYGTIFWTHILIEKTQ